MSQRKKAKIGDVVIVRGPFKPTLGIIIEDRHYQPVVFVRSKGLLGNELGISYDSWEYEFEIVGHIDLNNLYNEALEMLRDYEHEKKTD